MPTALASPYTWRDDHVTAELGGARALFTTRNGGVSSGAFASLNLGRLTADDGANVDENRQRVADRTGCPRNQFLYGRQVHGATVRRATEPPGSTRTHAEEDGQATRLGRHPALVFVADCLPVLLISDAAVAAIHAGWRGIAAGILQEGMDAIEELGGARTTALLGPGARGCCYEVGEEVHARFAAHDARVGARNLDLAKVATQQLETAGAEVHDTGLCTMCRPDLFFSHRRDDGVTGRQAGIVWLS